MFQLKKLPNGFYLAPLVVCLLCFFALVFVLPGKIEAETAESISTNECISKWNRNLGLGLSGEDVLKLQAFLNSDPSTALEVSEGKAGSKGNESRYYGQATRAAVIKFQEKHREDILNKIGQTQKGTGFVGALTRNKLNSMCGWSNVNLGELKILEVATSSEDIIVEIRQARETEGVKMFTFDVVTSGKGITLTSIPVTVETFGATNHDMFEKLDLYNDGVLIESKNISSRLNSSVVTFDNLNLPITENSSKRFIIEATVRTLPLANFNRVYSANLTVEGSDVHAVDMDGTEIQGTRIAKSQKSIFRTQGIKVNVLETSESILKEEDSISGVFKIKYKVTAFGEDAYIMNSATKDTGEAYKSRGGNIFSVTGTSTVSAAGLTSTAYLDGSSYYVKNGTSEEFTLTVVLTGGDGFSQVGLKTIEYSDPDSAPEYYPVLQEVDTNPLYISVKEDSSGDISLSKVTNAY